MKLTPDQTQAVAKFLKDGDVSDAESIAQDRLIDEAVSSAMTLSEARARMRVDDP
jgi:hypothetical protein